MNTEIVTNSVIGAIVGQFLSVVYLAISDWMHRNEVSWPWWKALPSLVVPLAVNVLILVAAGIVLCALSRC